MATAHCRLSVKAVPNAPRSEIAGWLGEALKVKLQAPPVDGRANTELCTFLAATLGLPRSAVSIATGDASRLKLVRIDGLDLAAVHARLGRPSGGG